ncbi:MAG TPA: hypothetical protein VFT88_04695 [Acidobacteriaceae bacterium]|nr:hypothetical protein [Acidobacteriaceae bacterium]
MNFTIPSRTQPLVSVLAYYGGQEPDAAAWTIAAFFEHVRSLRNNCLDDAGILAARFIAWLGHECRDSEVLCDFDGVEIIRNSERYRDYLTARIYFDRSGAHAKFVEDGTTSAEECFAAEAILNLATRPVETI